MSEALLRDIADYCRSIGIAESTFGRLAVNDGKLVGRLRLGGRVRTDTAERVRAFIAREPSPTINSTPLPFRALARPRRRQHRQPGLREAGRAGDLSRRPQIPA
jgi:hypothetical protein